VAVQVLQCMASNGVEARQPEGFCMVLLFVVAGSPLENLLPRTCFLWHCVALCGKNHAL